MPLADAFARAAASHRRAFIAYLTAGDPDLAATGRFVRALVRAGADIIELGVPHSDPVADGPTNLKAAQRALASGTTLRRILDFVRQLRGEGVTVPLVLFTYFNPVLRFGVEAFAASAAASGVDGVLIVDLPPEEASEVVESLRARGLDTIFLASPTTPPERLRRLDELSSGFLYYVSRTGVTGARRALSGSLAFEVERLRRAVKQPIAVGFGVSTPEQVREVARLGDGVIVGSALVKRIEEAGSVEEAEKNLEEFTKTLTKELVLC